MARKVSIAITLLAALTCVGADAPAAAQSDRSPTVRPSALPRHARRITINPQPLLYQRCVDWYELQHRPSGTVLYPQMRCWWVRG